MHIVLKERMASGYQNLSEHVTGKCPFHYKQRTAPETPLPSIHLLRTLRKILIAGEQSH